MRIALLAVNWDDDYFESLRDALSKSNEVFDLRFRLKDCLKIIDRIDEIAPDVVHIVFEARFPFFMINRIKHPIVLTLHEPDPYFSNSLLRKIIINPLGKLNNRLLAKYVNIIIVHGENHKNIVNEYSKNIIIIPHMAMDNFNVKDNNVAEENDVLYLGRIWQYKGLDYLLKALSIVQKEIPDIKSIIAGKGDFKPYYGLAEKVNHSFRYNEHLSNDEIVFLIKKSAMVVLPYIHGSQTGWISLAYKCKKPVITTNTGNLIDYVKNGSTGIIVEPKNEMMLASVIKSLYINKKLCNQMGMNGFNLVKQWDINKIVEKHLNVYRQVAE